MGKLATCPLMTDLKKLKRHFLRTLSLRDPSMAAGPCYIPTLALNGRRDRDRDRADTKGSLKLGKSFIRNVSRAESAGGGGVNVASDDRSDAMR